MDKRWPCPAGISCGSTVAITGIVSDRTPVCFSPLLRSVMSRATIQYGANDIAVVATGEMAEKLSATALGSVLMITGTLRSEKHVLEIDAESMTAP